MCFIRKLPFDGEHPGELCVLSIHTLILLEMLHELPKLPYAENALSQVLSEETVLYHYGKHERAYVDNLNKIKIIDKFLRKIDYLCNLLFTYAL